MTTRPAFPGIRRTRWGHPNESARNRVIYRKLEQMMEHVAERYVHGKLLDVGCGDKPWQPLLGPHTSEYIGVDLGANSKAELLADAHAIPLADATVDTVLMDEVLEHLERPWEALAEAHRLLRPGGFIVIDTPFFWPLHEAPRDFYRYSPFGLRELLETAGFEVVEIVPLTGAWVTISLEISYALQRYRRGPLRPLVDVAARLIQWAAVRWELVDFQPAFSCLHLAVGRKRP
jgi:SAM-dependent methyltransferase